MPGLEKTAFIAYKLDLAEYHKPVISNRNRLEGSPRSEEFERSLRAEVRDPLWMLCRQWQFGEFKGEDAGTAIQAKILAEHRTPSQIMLSNGHTESYAGGQPLEMLVEREAVQPTLLQRVQITRYVLCILRQQLLDNFLPYMLQRYPLDATVDPEDREAVLLAMGVRGRLPDGHKILADMRSGQFLTHISVAPGYESSVHKAKFVQMQTLTLHWYADFYQQPASGESAWVSEHLEYNFALAFPPEDGKQTLLIADQYASGHLDWYAFDEIQRTTTEPATVPVSEEKIQTFIPTPLQFRGMPNPRYWQMEEGTTDFGKIDASTTGLLNVLLAEYGLTYSNDWFILPYELKINTVCEVRGLMVKDVFGVNILIESALNDPETQWQEFAIFHQTERGNATQKRNRFYLPPVIGRMLESDPLEKVNFMRDEMANMVWAVEHIVPSEAGGGRELRRNLSRLAPGFKANAPDAEEPAKIRYVLGSTVPDNWIPFIPVHKDGANKEIRLQRARFPNAPAPRGMVLTEQQPTFFVEEEEVPRAGVIIERTFQRARWLQGRSYLWLGRRKMAGRGEAWSGLMFDQILPIEIPQ